MRKPSNDTGHRVGLILALVGLLSITTLVLEPAGGASAQVVGPSWSITGNLNTARISHTATLLLNGKVLIAGGRDDTGILNSAELYDPATGTWSLIGKLNIARSLPTATLLPSGKVLVVGGENYIGNT